MENLIDKIRIDKHYSSFEEKIEIVEDLNMDPDTKF